MRKALIVGIDDYKTCPLKGCCNDADSIEQILRCNGDESPNFSTKIFKNVQTKATLKKLRACLETHLSIMKRFNSMLAMAI